MSKIKIKNIGPIRAGYKQDEGWMNIKKITVLIGNQGTGKSTLAKLISTASWLEKSLVREDFDIQSTQINNAFVNEHCAYQNIHNYFGTDSTLEYEGNAYSLHYAKQKLSGNKLPHPKNYQMPKIMFVPAERNFLSAVDIPSRLKGLPSVLYAFLDEWEKAKEVLEKFVLPIGDVEFTYKKRPKAVLLQSTKHNYTIKLSEASSGFQSVLPLLLVTKYLTESLQPLSKEERSLEENRIKSLLEVLSKNSPESPVQDLIDDLSTRLDTLKERLSSLSVSCFLNIVEEPEQNLFPDSQRQVLNSLLEYANTLPDNQLVLTTHSPYLINFLTLSVKANSLWEKVTQTQNTSLQKQLEQIVPQNATIRPNDLAIYQFDNQGNITLLEDYKGLPSDDNALNEKLGETNDWFSDLLEIENKCQ